MDESSDAAGPSGTQATGRQSRGDDQSVTSSHGHEDFFEKELRAFIRKNRDAVQEQNDLLQEAERSASSAVAALADKRAKLELSAAAREKSLVEQLQKDDVSLAEAQDLRVKLEKLRRKKKNIAAELDKKAKAADEALAVRKRKWAVYMGDYEEAKEAEEARAMRRAAESRDARFSTMEYLVRAEKRPPKPGDTPQEKTNYNDDMRELAHLRNIRQAHENYSTYVQAQRSGGSPAKRPPQKLLPLKKIRVMAPKATDPPAKKTKVTRKPAKIRDDVFEQAARSIARYVQDWKRMDSPEGDQPDVVDLTEESGHEDHHDDDPEFQHETQLRETLKPDALLTPDWNLQVADEDLVPGGDAAPGMVPLLHQILRQQATQQRISHLHSLALCRCVNMLNDIKARVVGDIQKDKETAALLKKANQAVILASDPELKRLPFRTVTSISAFMNDPTKVEKLTLYLLNFHPYVEKTYAKTLIAALLHPSLQEAVYWSYGIPKPR